MCRQEKLEQFVKLGKNEKKNLTLSWLTDLIKSENLSIADVIDILNCIQPTFSKADKLNAVLINGVVTTSTISRILGYGYAKSVKLINEMLSKNLIVKFDNSYKVIDKDNFKIFTQNLFGGENV